VTTIALNVGNKVQRIIKVVYFSQWKAA